MRKLDFTSPFSAYLWIMFRFHQFWFLDLEITNILHFSNFDFEQKRIELGRLKKDIGQKSEGMDDQLIEPFMILDGPSQALVASRLKIPSKVDVQGKSGRSTADRQLNVKRLCERLLYEKRTVNFRNRPFRVPILFSSTAQFCAPVNFQKKHFDLFGPKVLDRPF